eukprot:scaffold38518_cov54-Phaeocystis_antarctica.AAC.1
MLARPRPLDDRRALPRRARRAAQDLLGALGGVWQPAVVSAQQLTVGCPNLNPRGEPAAARPTPNPNPNRNPRGSHLQRHIHRVEERAALVAPRAARGNGAGE